MSIVELERSIQILRRELNEIATARPMTTDILRRYEMVRTQIVSQERELCLAQQIQTVVPLQGWNLKWTQYHGNARLDSSESGVVLTCEVYVTSPDLFVPATMSFKGCVASKWIAIDYDRIEDFPMFHAGLEGLGAYSVVNSRWVSEVKHDTANTGYVHFLFCFSSCIVEAIANDLSVKLGQAIRGTAPAEKFGLPVRKS